MHELQQLGESLLEINDYQRQQLGLSASLIEALDLAKTMTTGNTKRRQLQLIGKLMRDEDADVIRTQLFDLNTQYHHQDTVVSQWIQRFRQDSRQHLSIFERIPISGK